jgi:holo-[acyl-carrier protein] synthase
MVVGTGIDMERVAAIERAVSRFGERFLHRIYTDAEIVYCESRARWAQSYTARFAAKEALRKALAAPPGIRWRDIEVTRAASGAPGLLLHGRAREAAAALGVRHLHLSLSHSGEYAIASVALEG